MWEKLNETVLKVFFAWLSKITTYLFIATLSTQTAVNQKPLVTPPMTIMDTSLQGLSKSLLAM